MISPDEAYAIARKNKPRLSLFSKNCVDYHGCWVFSLSGISGKPLIGAYIYIDKEDGSVYPFDPAFDIEEFLEALNVSDQVNFEDEPMTTLSEIRKTIGKRGR